MSIDLLTIRRSLKGECSLCEMPVLSTEKRLDMEVLDRYTGETGRIVICDACLKTSAPELRAILEEELPGALRT